MPKKKTAKKSARPKTPKKASRPAGKKAAKRTRRTKKAARKKPTAPPADRTAPVESWSDTELSERWEAKKEKAASRERALSMAGREIGTIPERADPDRREACRYNLRLFCETYFPKLFFLGWSKAHLRTIKQLEKAVLEGGLFGLAMPRGSGKSTLSLVAVFWAILFGHRSYVVLVAATEKKAKKIAKVVKHLLRTKGTILEQDFPEVVIPCAELAGKANLANGQLHRGHPTGIEWSDDQIVLPTLNPIYDFDENGKEIRDRNGNRVVLAEAPPSDCYGSIIGIAGITGEIRGQFYYRGETLIRPDFVICDDPQTKQSAQSGDMTKFRLEVLDEDILGLAGPTETISVVMPCTVIATDDMADQILNPDKYPDWQSERIPMLIHFPKNLGLWDEYREYVIAAKKSGHYADANAFYRKNRKKMEAGCEHYWPERLPDKYKGLTAIQFAMDWFLTRPKSFWSECQQSPQGDTPPDADLLTADEITMKQHTEGEGVPPIDADVVVAMIDVQGDLLFYTVIAFNLRTFSGYVLAYQAWPTQSTRNFTLASARKKLSSVYKGRGGKKLSRENMLRRAIKDCAKWLLDERWEKENGVEMSIQRLVVDGGFEAQAVREAVKELADGRVWVSFGRDVELTGKKQPGDKRGDNWRARDDREHGVRFITFRPNPWKCFVHARFATDIGESGSLSLYHDEPFRHQTYAEHQRAEIRTQYDDGRPTKWTLPPSKPDQHFFDCTVGCHVLAEHEGANLWGADPDRSKKKKRKSLAERQRERLARERAA